MASEVEKVVCALACVQQYLLEAEFDAASTAVKAASDLIEAQAAAIAALRAQDREGAREPFTQPHRADTLRYMLDRAERMSRCFYRAGMTEDGARYREEADALTWLLAALPLSPVRTEDGNA